LTGPSVQDFYRSAVARGAGFEGQLGDDFQARLAAEYASLGPDDCDFYHTLEMGEERHEGVWDLRGRERGYLGYVDVKGQRVLELGPASGHVTFYMGRMGADVVGFDLPPGMATDVIPQEGHDIEAHRRLSVGYMERVRNSWWYGHRRFGSASRAVYGDIYNLPSDLRRFDVSILCSILMHLSKPFYALQQAASITDRAIVITEPIPRIPLNVEPGLMEFAPMGSHETVVLWWALTPGAIIRMLRVFGFLEFSVHYHLQSYHPKHEMDKPPVETLFFTVVGERHKGWAPRLALTDAERAAEAELRRTRGEIAPVPPDALAALQDELDGLRSSLSWRLTKPLRLAGSVLRRAGLR
jgi:SAM-dependent methyltransferase